MRIRALSLPLFIFASASGLAAQIPEGVAGAFEPHPEAEEAISRLYSPFCPGFMLDVCTASQSSALRDSIQMFAYQGWTSDELEDWMIANYGEEYRAVPETGGVGFFAWILPVFGLLTGIVIVVLALRRFDPGRRPVEPVHSEDETLITADEQARLRSAIREIELSEDPSF